MLFDHSGREPKDAGPQTGGVFVRDGDRVFIVEVGVPERTPEPTRLPSVHTTLGGRWTEVRRDPRRLPGTKESRNIFVELYVERPVPGPHPVRPPARVPLHREAEKRSLEVTVPP